MELPYITGRAYPVDPIPALRENAGEETLILLETSLAVGDEDKTYLFKRPVAVITADSPGDQERLYRAMEEALAQGYWLAGWFQYEWGYVTVPGLARCLKRKHPPGPLVWMGVFRGPEEIEMGGRGPRWDQEVRRAMGPLELDTSREEYVAAIRAIKEYIAQGHTYQVNYTVRARFPYRYDPVALYEALRATQPVPYGAYIRAAGRHIIALSPELFFRIDGDLITSRPMKGTAPRGRTVAEDVEIAGALARDPKNRAENVMIVDLLRNDIGRISRMGSVQVPHLFTVERYPTLFQMTSTVQGRLREQRLAAIFRALFPCGSVTGAPKRRTMEIIEELERSPRGIYTGSIGYLAPEGRGVFNVAIRTVEIMGDVATLGIGSGVTIGSDPVEEYEECRLKALFVEREAREFQLIETLLLRPGERGKGFQRGYFLLHRHLARLQESAHYFGFPFSRKEALRRLEAVARGAQGGRSWRVRLLLHRHGALDTEIAPLQPCREPVRVAIAHHGWRADPADPLLYHKTTLRHPLDQLTARARKEGLFDYLILNRAGELTQGSFTTLFADLGGDTLVTPPLSAGLLPGTLRAHLLERGEAAEGTLTPRDLMAARVVYVGNSLRGLLRAELVAR